MRSVKLRPGEPVERDPLLFCPAHWDRLNFHRRAWALVWATTAIAEDQRLRAELGLLDTAPLNPRLIDLILATKPACCRLSSRAEHLYR